MNLGWFVGILGILAGLVAVSLAWRARRHWRTLRHGKYIDLTVVSTTMGERAPRNTVWMHTVLSARLPDGSSRRVRATVQVHLERVEEVQPGLVLRGRVDPRDGELDGYDYIQIDADHLAEGPSGGAVP